MPNGTCSHQAVANGYTCRNLTLDGCQGGAEVTQDCRAVCKGAGYNVAATCSLGTDPNLCACASWTTACNTSSTACYNASAQFSRDAARQLWTVEDCSAYCRTIGYLGSDGCRAQVGFCTCVGTITCGSTTYACHGSGGDCSGSTSYCCAGLACTWYYNGGNPLQACSTPTSCDPKCVQGAVCCGGAFCAGDCIGNPCCS